MNIVNISQRTQEWHKWRAGGVSASDAPVILGVSPYKTPWRLWAEKVGKVEPEDLDNNPNVKRGVRLEDEIRKHFEEKHPGEILLPVCAEHREHDWIRASLDGLTSKNEPVEMKAPVLKRFLDAVENGLESEIAKLYFPQVQHQILVTGANRGFLCLYCEEADDPYLELSIEEDQDFIRKELIPALSQFHNWVVLKKEPTKDPERDLFIPEGDLIPRWDEHAAAWLAADREQKNLEERIKMLREAKSNAAKALVSLMGEFVHGEGGGVKVANSQVAGSIDYRKVVEERLPDLKDEDLEGYRRKGRKQIRVTPIKTTSEKEAKNRKNQKLSVVVNNDNRVIW